MGYLFENMEKWTYRKNDVRQRRQSNSKSGLSYPYAEN
jgi:hypothetical protein